MAALPLQLDILALRPFAGRLAFEQSLVKGAQALDGGSGFKQSIEGEI